MCAACTGAVIPVRSRAADGRAMTADVLPQNWIDPNTGWPTGLGLSASPPQSRLQAVAGTWVEWCLWGLRCAMASPEQGQRTRPDARTRGPAGTETRADSAFIRRLPTPSTCLAGSSSIQARPMARPTLPPRSSRSRWVPRRQSARKRTQDLDRSKSPGAKLRPRTGELSRCDAKCFDNKPAFGATETRLRGWFFHARTVQPASELDRARWP